MSRALLNPKAAGHLARICGMFGSDHDGERAAAASLAHQHVKRPGLSRHEVIRVETHWRTTARACREHLFEFNKRERELVPNMTRLRGAPSEKQLGWLEALFERIDAAKEQGT